MKVRLFTILIILIGQIEIVIAQSDLTEALLTLPLKTTFSPHQYNGGIQNWDITQDSASFIYVANNYGLLEFDGVRWTKHSHKNQTKLRSVCVEKEMNIIYVGGQNQLGYFQRTESAMIYKDLTGLIDDSVRIDEVWRIFEADRKIYINLYEDLAWIEDEEIKVVPSPVKIEFAFAIKDQIFAHAKNGHILKLNDDGKFHYLTNTVLSGQVIGGMSLNGAIYFFTYEGIIYAYRNGVLEDPETEVSAFLRKSKINTVRQLKDGTIAIGTQNDGLLMVSDHFELIRHLTKNRGLTHRTVLSMYQDEFENLWVGLNNGLEVIDLKSAFSIINEDIGVEGTGYSALMDNDHVFLATSSGLFTIPRTRSNIGKSEYEIVKGSEGLVNKITKVGDDIIICHHEGAFTLNNGVLEKFYDGGSWDFRPTHDNRIIGGTYEGLFLFQKNQSRWELDSKLDKLNESSRIFEFENDSTIWMTHGYKGAYRISLNPSLSKTRKVTRYGNLNGFPSDILINVYQIKDEIIFTGSTDVFSFDNEKDRFFPHSFLNNWFESKHVSKLTYVPPNLVFYISDGQLGFLKEETIGNYQNESSIFKRVNNFINNDLENISYLDKKNVVIGAKEGFILYQPNNRRTSSFPKSPILKKVEWTNDKNEEFTSNTGFLDELDLTSPRLLKFTFCAPYYDGIEDMDFSYRLFPYESEWSSWTTTGWKEYTSVPNGSYTFQVRVRNVYGEVSPASLLEVNVSPKWYKSNTTYLGLTITSLSFLGFIFFKRETKFRKRTQAIRLTKDAEIEEKQQEIKEFSAKKTQEIEALRSESLKNELDHKNKQLASITMHLLSKNEFVRSVRKKLVEALDHLVHKEEISRIIKVIDKNIDEDDGWQTFAYHFDQVHGDFLKNIRKQVKLTSQETKLCAYLRLNMSTKDIASLMNITVRSVELSRYRLRKKLDIPRAENLTDYLSRF